MSEPEFEREWMPGRTEVAARTNRVINTLIRQMREQEVYEVSPQKVDIVIQKVAGVGGETTVESYRKRLVDHGPFAMTFGGLSLHEDYHDG